MPTIWITSHPIQPGGPEQGGPEGYRFHDPHAGDPDYCPVAELGSDSMGFNIVFGIAFLIVLIWFVL
jgi:hypothetical protein